MLSKNSKNTIDWENYKWGSIKRDKGKGYIPILEAGKAKDGVLYYGKQIMKDG